MKKITIIILLMGFVISGLSFIYTKDVPAIAKGGAPLAGEMTVHGWPLIYTVDGSFLLLPYFINSLLWTVPFFIIAINLNKYEK